MPHTTGSNGDTPSTDPRKRHATGGERTAPPRDRRLCAPFSGAPRGRGSFRRWGRTDSGEIGDGATGFRAEPTLVGGGLTFTSLSAGGRHTRGITTGQFPYWGSESDGQLGNDGTQGTNALLPVRVVRQRSDAGPGAIEASFGSGQPRQLYQDHVASCVSTADREVPVDAALCGDRLQYCRPSRSRHYASGRDLDSPLRVAGSSLSVRGSCPSVQ